MNTTSAAAILGLTTATLLGIPGCVKRTLKIDTRPDEALVWVNGRELGRTPLEVGMTYYGEYELRLERDGYTSVTMMAKATPGAWDVIGPDLVAELVPWSIDRTVTWTVSLEPVDPDRGALINRGNALRATLTEEPQPTTSTQP
jgi:hypothetical protein